MDEAPKSDKEVVILPPDQSLLDKIGVKNLDEVFSAQTVHTAQEIIKNSADDFKIETLADVRQLETVLQRVVQTGLGSTNLLAPLVVAAFSLKSKAGLAGYDLISALAKSLYLYCEAMDNRPLSQKILEVIQWHIMSIQQMVNRNIKGDGGEMGKAITAELARLAATFKD